MRRTFVGIVIVLCLVTMHVLFLDVAGRAREKLPQPQDQGYVLPGAMLRVLTGEYRGLAADFFFLQGLVAYGRTLEGRMSQVEKEQAWQRAYHLLDASVDLDPWFFDPYYFANASLSRNPALVPDINRMLEKGLDRRDWDWMLPFFLGFNHFYYLQDNAKAAEYLMLGAQRPDASPLLATLGARLAYQGRRTENAIVFLRGILSKTKDEQTRELYLTRLKALEGVYVLEQALALYQERFGTQAPDLNALLSGGILVAIPEDPYGGTFYLGDDGTIQSTSGLTYVKGATAKPN